MIVNKDLQILQKALDKLKEGFDSFPDSFNQENSGKIEATLLKVAKRMQDNYPYFQPQYAGQMLKPPHAIARLAYMLQCMLIPIIMQWMAVEPALQWRKKLLPRLPGCLDGHNTSVILLAEV